MGRVYKVPTKIRKSARECIEGGKTDVCKRKDVELLVRDAEVAFYLTNPTNPSIFGWVVLFSFTSVR